MLSVCLTPTTCHASVAFMVFSVPTLLPLLLNEREMGHGEALDMVRQEEEEGEEKVTARSQEEVEATEAAPAEADTEQETQEAGSMQDGAVHAIVEHLILQCYYN